METVCLTIGIRGSYAESQRSASLSALGISLAGVSSLMATLVSVCLAELNELYSVSSTALLKELMPSSTATNVAWQTDQLVRPTSRLARPTQPAPKTNYILNFELLVLRTLPLLVPPIQPPSCTPPGFPVFYTCSTLCNVCVIPLPAAIPTAEYVARIARIAPLAPPFHYCAASVPALCLLCLGPLPQPLLCRWRTPCLQQCCQLNHS